MYMDKRTLTTIKKTVLQGLITVYKLIYLIYDLMY